jgi:hypothetical protein
MVIAHENDVSRQQGIADLLLIKDSLVSPEGFTELAQIFPAAGRILRTDFTFHSCQRVKLGGAAAGT